MSYHVRAASAPVQAPVPTRGIVFFAGLPALPPADETQGDLMKKKVSKKLTLSRETKPNLEVDTPIAAALLQIPIPHFRAISIARMTSKAMM